MPTLGLEVTIAVSWHSHSNFSKVPFEDFATATVAAVTLEEIHPFSIVKMSLLLCSQTSLDKSFGQLFEEITFLE